MKNNVKKICMIVGGIVLVAVILVVAAFSFMNATSKKIKCSTSNSSITLYYNDESLVGYEVVNMEFDLDYAKNIVNTVGIDEYIDQFEEVLEDDYSGVCERSE